MDNIENKAVHFLKKYNLLDTDKPILLAFSGGFDSMCLLNICHKLGLNITAIHLNHNWRGEESKKEEENCRDFCNIRGINFYTETLSLDIPKTETAAREARYEFFKKCANMFNSEAVLTAHNANDNAETVIYRIAKGTGVAGLSGISEIRDIYYRPLLGVKREDIEKYCKKYNLTPNSDSSNNNTKYKRNFIRQTILPEFKKINNSAIDTINSLSEIARLDNEIIETYLKSLDMPYLTKNFTNYSDSVKSRLCYNLFIENNLDYDREKISRAINFIEENKSSKSGKTLSLSTDLQLFVNEKNIEIIKISPKNSTEIKISKCGEYEFEDKIFIIKEFNEKPTKFPNDSELTAYVDLNGINELSVRHRKDGDTIKPLGCNGSQKLKKYLNEKKIPQHKKNKLLLLSSGKEVLWVPSVGLSDRIKVVTAPTHVLKLLNK